MDAIVGLTKRKPVDPDAASSDTNSYASHTSCSSLMDDILLNDAVSEGTMEGQSPTPNSATDADVRKFDPPGELLVPDNRYSSNRLVSKPPLLPLSSSSSSSPPRIHRWHTGDNDLLAVARRLANTKLKRTSTVRSVHFDTVEVREYSSNVAMTLRSAADYQCDDEKELVWEAHSVSNTNLDDYEASRSTSTSSLPSNEKAQSRIKKDSIGEFSRVRLSAVDEAFTTRMAESLPPHEADTMASEEDARWIALVDHGSVRDSPSSLLKRPKRRLTGFARRFIGRSNATNSMNHM